MVLLSENPCQHSPHWALAEPLHDLVGECVRGEIGTPGCEASPALYGGLVKQPDGVRGTARPR